jgi:flagellar biogenesis protein FliO
MSKGIRSAETRTVGGLAGWLMARLRSRHRPQPSLALLERITLAPRQSLALVEADGRRFLVATSPEGAPAFYALEERKPKSGLQERLSSAAGTRVSW